MENKILMGLVRYILLFIGFTGLVSCHQKPLDVDENLLGTWVDTLWVNDSTIGKLYTITIVEEGKSSYYEDWGDTAYIETTGKAKVSVKNNSDDLLIIGKKQFTINNDAYVYEDSAGAEIVQRIMLSQIVYTKQ